MTTYSIFIDTYKLNNIQIGVNDMTLNDTIEIQLLNIYVAIQLLKYRCCNTIEKPEIPHVQIIEGHISTNRSLNVDCLKRSLALVNRWRLSGTQCFRAFNKQIQY